VVLPPYGVSAPSSYQDCHRGIAGVEKIVKLQYETCDDTKMNLFARQPHPTIVFLSFLGMALGYTQCSPDQDSRPQSTTASPSEDTQKHQEALEQAQQELQAHKQQKKKPEADLKGKTQAIAALQAQMSTAEGDKTSPAQSLKQLQDELEKLRKEKQDVDQRLAKAQEETQKKQAASPSSSTQKLQELCQRCIEILKQDFPVPKAAMQHVKADLSYEPRQAKLDRLIVAILAVVQTDNSNPIVPAPSTQRSGWRLSKGHTASTSDKLKSQNETYLNNFRHMLQHRQSPKSSPTQAQGYENSYTQDPDQVSSNIDAQLEYFSTHHSGNRAVWVCAQVAKVFWEARPKDGSFCCEAYLQPSITAMECLQEAWEKVGSSG